MEGIEIIEQNFWKILLGKDDFSRRMVLIEHRRQMKDGQTENDYFSPFGIWQKETFCYNLFILLIKIDDGL